LTCKTEVVRNRTFVANQPDGYPEGGKTYTDVLMAERGNKGLHQFEFLDNARKGAFDDPSTQFTKFGERDAFLKSMGASIKMHFFVRYRNWDWFRLLQFYSPLK
jgi:hypothetical protein